MIEEFEWSCRPSGRGRNRKYTIEGRHKGVVVVTERMHADWWKEVKRGDTAPFDAFIRCLMIVADGTEI